MQNFTSCRLCNSEISSNQANTFSSSGNRIKTQKNKINVNTPKEGKDVRKQQKTILWSVYFDSSKTRKEGRRVPKSVAVPNPTLTELQKAAQRLGMKPETEDSLMHPATPWQKTGRIRVQKKETKKSALMKIAREMLAIRQQTRK